MLNRYVKSGISSLNDYEIVELILTFAIQRKDTKPIAKQLIARYGGVSAVLNAPLDDIRDIDGLGERSVALLALIRDTMAYCLNENCVKKPMMRHRGDIEEYLRFNFGYCREEYVAAVFLDNGNCIIGTEIVARGTVNRCVIYPRKIMELAVKCGAAAFVLAHNHPAGVAEPSEKDWDTTDRMFETGLLMDIPLKDHIIISRDRVISLRENPRWPEF